MTRALGEPLARAASLTFEELALLFASPLDAAIQGEPEAAVSIGFHGPLRGRLVLRTFDGLLGVLAANMLGLDAEPPDRLQRDALGETANVICGNLLPLIGGVDDVYQLDAPRPVAPTAPGAPAPAGEVALDLECGRAHVLLFLENPAAVPA